jgi:hypothetical protein
MRYENEEEQMNSVDVQIKGNTGEVLSLTVTSSDSPERVAERVATITWIIRQVSGTPEPRRRAARGETPQLVSRESAETQEESR